MIFTLTLAAGIGFGGSERISEKVFDYLQYDCVRWDKQTLARPLFTLKEAAPLLGKKVYFKGSSLYPQNAGRVRMMQIVGYDKFLIVIDRKINLEEGQESQSFYDKDILPNLEFED